MEFHASDSALVTAASRNGVDPAIRRTLASGMQCSDTRQSRLGSIRGRDRYFSVYARQALDAYSELQRFRNAGVATPSGAPITGQAVGLVLQRHLPHPRMAP
jgi:hypothetical protein